MVDVLQINLMKKTDRHKGGVFFFGSDMNQIILDNLLALHRELDKKNNNVNTGVTNIFFICKRNFNHELKIIKYTFNKK